MTVFKSGGGVINYELFFLHHLSGEDNLIIKIATIRNLCIKFAKHSNFYLYEHF